MKYLLAFIFCGFICAVGQLILEKTKFTPGHINTILVIVGCILSSFGIYDKCIEIFSCGATVPIVNFGHLLTLGASEGFKNYGILGLFKGLYTYASCGLSSAIFSAFIISLLFKVKN